MITNHKRSNNMDIYVEKLISITSDIEHKWKAVTGFAPAVVDDKMQKAMLNWMVSLTECLRIWVEKGDTMSVGELILANTNLGALVECWLKFFYSVHYLDYEKEPLLKDGKLLPPEELTFNNLKKYSDGKLWEGTESWEYCFVDSVQHKRNAIHAFKERDLGDAKAFMESIEQFYRFVNLILERIPPIED